MWSIWIDPPPNLRSQSPLCLPSPTTFSLRGCVVGEEHGGGGGEGGGDALALCVFTAEIIKVVRAGLDKGQNELCDGLKADARMHARAHSQRKGFAKSRWWWVLPFVAILLYSSTRVRVRDGLHA